MSLFVTRLSLSAALIALAVSASAQDEPAKLEVGGQVEQFVRAARVGDAFRAEEYMRRILIELTYSHFKLVGSYWWYPSWDLKETDEAWIGYEGDRASFKVGRFMVPFGQSDWYSQWYSGFVQGSFIEDHSYSGPWFPFERTSVGVQADVTLGDSHTLHLAGVDKDIQQDHLAPKRLDRAVARIEGYRSGITYGASAYVDTKTLGKDQRILALDARWTGPQWMVRGEILRADNDSQKVDGYFVDLTYRPKGWTDVTLVARNQAIRAEGVGGYRLQNTILGAKVRLPLETTLAVNYAFGPDMNRQGVGAGWCFGLYRTFRY